MRPDGKAGCIQGGGERAKTHTRGKRPRGSTAVGKGDGAGGKRPAVRMRRARIIRGNRRPTGQDQDDFRDESPAGKAAGSYRPVPASNGLMSGYRNGERLRRAAARNRGVSDADAGGAAASPANDAPPSIPDMATGRTPRPDAFPGSRHGAVPSWEIGASAHHGSGLPPHRSGEMPHRAAKKIPGPFVNDPGMPWFIHVSAPSP